MKYVVLLTLPMMIAASDREITSMPPWVPPYATRFVENLWQEEATSSSMSTLERMYGFHSREEALECTIKNPCQHITLKYSRYALYKHGNNEKHIFPREEYEFAIYHRDKLVGDIGIAEIKKGDGWQELFIGGFGGEEREDVIGDIYDRYYDKNVRILGNRPTYYIEKNGVVTKVVTWDESQKKFTEYSPERWMSDWKAQYEQMLKDPTYRKMMKLYGKPGNVK